MAPVHFIYRIYMKHLGIGWEHLGTRWEVIVTRLFIRCEVFRKLLGTLAHFLNRFGKVVWKSVGKCTGIDEYLVVAFLPEINAVPKYFISCISVGKPSGID